MLLIIKNSRAQIFEKCENKSESFDLRNGDSALCDDAIFNPTFCDKEVFKKNCPKACNTCCRDQPDKFTIDGGLSRRCSVLEGKPHLCNKDHFRNNCPESCGICTCRNHTGKFVNKVNKPLSCDILDKYEIKCRNDLFKKNCPESCNTCPIRDSSYMCEIDAEIRFPSIDEASKYGYHNDSVEVTKYESDEKCNSESGTTSWGCKHSGGNALIMKLQDPKYYDYLESESLHIKNAAEGSFQFRLKHHFDLINEGYYNGDETMVGKLSIKATGNRKKIFSHPLNKNVDTQKDDGSINPDYHGEITVDVKCDSRCECSFAKTVVKDN